MCVCSSSGYLKTSISLEKENQEINWVPQKTKDLSFEMFARKRAFAPHRNLRII